jgi:PTH1 family peptidyl-tRNA hydrolase
MKLLVGLGNPGAQYARTRHNAGFMVIDRLQLKFGAGAGVKARFQSAASEVTIAGEPCLLMKPTTFMNRSGQSVSEAVRFFKLDPRADLLVITDDLYLPTGALRMRPSGGAGGHNGLSNIEALLPGQEYPRLRIGVGRQPSGGKPALMDQADFVLSRFTDEEEPLLLASLEKGAEAAEAFVTAGLDRAMNLANGPEPVRKATKSSQPDQAKQESRKQKNTEKETP